MQIGAQPLYVFDSAVWYLQDRSLSHRCTRAFAERANPYNADATVNEGSARRRTSRRSLRRDALVHTMRGDAAQTFGSSVLAYRSLGMAEQKNQITLGTAA